MANRNSGGVTLWLYLFLMLLSSAILLSLNSDIDPIERALGIAHGECVQTRHATLYSFDNLFATDVRVLQENLPEGTLVEQRAGTGALRLLLLGFLALVAAYSFGQTLRQCTRELAEARLKIRSLGWLIPSTLGIFLASLPSTPLFLVYGFLVLQLAFLSARQTVPSKKLCRLIKRLNWFGTVWIAQLSAQLLGVGTADPMATVNPWAFGLILGLSILPVGRCLPSRIKGSPIDAGEAGKLWSIRRYWLLTAVLVLTLGSVLSPGQPLQKPATVFALPLALFFLCSSLLSSFAFRADTASARLSSIGRIAACNWLVVGASCLVAATAFCDSRICWFTIGWLAVSCCLLLSGRPWGSRVQGRHSAFDSRHQTPGNATRSLFEQSQVPGMSAVVMAFSILCAGLGRWLDSGWAELARSPLDSWPDLFLKSQIRQLETPNGTLTFLSEYHGKSASASPGATINIAHSWPEATGSILLFCGGLAILGLLLLWVNHRLDSETRTAVSGQGSLLFGTLFGAYAIAGMLGWHWYPALPFLCLYGICVAAPALIKRLPIRDQQPAMLRPTGPRKGPAPGPLDFTFRNALGVRVMVGKRVWRFLAEEASDQQARLLGFVDQHHPPTSLKPEPDQIALFLDGVCLRKVKIQSGCDLVDFAHILEATIRERARHRLTRRNTEAWLELQSNWFPEKVEQIKRSMSTEVVQNVLLRLVHAGSLLEKPSALLEVLANETGDEIALAERCLKRLEQE